VREDENLGGSDRVEPFLDPAPDRREERRCANDLGASSVFMFLSKKQRPLDSQIFDPMSPGNEP